MEQTNENTVEMSTQMRAVMTVISACSDLYQHTKPHIVFGRGREEVNWPAIFKERWTSGQKTALAWAFAVWRGEPRPKINLFEASNLMDQELQVAVLHALMIRWGFGKKSIELFDQPTTILGGVS